MNIVVWIFIICFVLTGIMIIGSFIIAVFRTIRRIYVSIRTKG